MFPQSIATATCTRVSNALGSGDAEAARGYFRTALVMVFLQQSLLASLILSFSPNLVSFFCTGMACMYQKGSLNRLTCCDFPQHVPAAIAPPCLADPAVMSIAQGIVPMVAFNTMCE
jgi:Na+-driven multidrug efflux pump